MYNTEGNVTYLTTISKVRLLLALYIGAKKTFVRTKFDVKNASSYVYKFFNLLFQRIREDIELKLQLAYSSFACKSSWILITSLDLSCMYFCTHNIIQRTLLY